MAHSPFRTGVLVTVAALVSVGCRSGSGAEASDESRAAVTETGRLIERAEAAYFRSAYDTARIEYEGVLAEASSQGDSAGVAHALTWLGLTAWRQGRYTDSRQLGEDALAIKLRLGLREELFRSYNALGLLADMEGRYSDAIELFTRARDAAAAVGDSLSLAKALGNLSLPYFEIGEFERALEASETLRRFSSTAGDTRSEANALTNIASAAIRLGDTHKGIEVLKEARVLYGQVQYPVGEENVLAQLGTVFHANGDPQSAIAYLDSALTITRRHGLKPQESENLQLLAQVFGELGDHRRALSHLREARALSEERGETAELGGIARAEAYEYLSLGGTETAKERVRDAIRYHTRAGAPLEVLRDQLLLAEVAQRAGDRDESRRALDSAAILARQLDVPLARGMLAVGSARVADLAADSRGVLDALSGRDTDLGRLGSVTEWEAHALRARAHSRMKQWDDAAASGRLAVSGIERVRGRIGTGPLRASYVEDRAQAYGDLVMALLRLDRQHEALEVADAARGRALLEHIGAARGHLRSASARELAEAERVLRRIDWLVERLQQADTIPQRERGPRTSGSAEYAAVAAMTRQLMDARREYEGLLHRVGATDPAAPAFFGSGAAVPGARASGSGMRAIQQALRDDEAMLQYFTTADTLILFVVTRADLRVAEVPLESDVLATRVRFARDMLRRRGPPSVAARIAMRDLYGVLIAPAVRTGMLEGKRRLVVVPHAALGHVPFSALLAEDGRYLVEDFSILTLPSSAALRMVRERKRSSEVNGVAVIAPFPDRLPGTKREAASVRRIAREANTLASRSATKPALRDALERARIVHVASHALLNELNPMFSRIDLAAPKRRTPDNNGRLEVHELLGMSVQSELVYLSGCETGSGVGWSNSFMRGQDYATLSQAFLYAGARNVIATLWRIDDDGAADFAGRFYRSLARQDPPEALAEAQRQMLRGASYQSPRYWAAYTVSGDGQLPDGVPTTEAKGGSPSVPFRFVWLGRRMGTH